MSTKYLEVYSTILKRIETKVYKVNDKIPSEVELMEAFQASRDTIRKALQLLQQQGYILKNKGKASTVLNVNTYAFPFSGITSFKELAQTLGDDVTTDVLACHLIVANEAIANKLNVKLQELVWEVIRVRTIARERIICDIDYLNATLVPNLTTAIAQNSLYEYIENELQLKIGFAKKEIRVVHKDYYDEQRLDMHDFSMIAVVESYTFLENGQQFQYTMSRHRPDKFHFVDFARRLHLF